MVKIDKKEIKHKLEKVVPVAILALSFVLIVIILVNSASTHTEVKSKHANIKLDEKLFLDEKNMIRFTTIDTAPEIYEILKNNCEEYIQNNDVTVSNIDINIEVTENKYVDSNNTVNKSTDDTLYETGPLYLQDKLIIRYINDNGELRVVASKLNKLPLIIDNINGTESYKTVGIDEIAEVFDNKQDMNSVYMIDKMKIEQSKKYNDDTLRVLGISEQTYLNDISDIFKDIMLSSSNNIDETVKNKALTYFTYEGYTNIVDSIDYIDPSSSNISINFIEAGKSDINSVHKDRIIMQIATHNGDNIIYTTVIVKLDENYKIFDIDIV